VYGGSAAGIAAQTGAPVALVEKAIQEFYRVNRNVYRFLEGVAHLAVEEGRLTSPFGRVRRFMGIDPSDPMKIARIQREAKNFYPQSGAAEQVFRSLNQMCRRFKRYKMKAWPVNIVYDNIIVEHPKSERRAVKDIMIEEMTRPVPELDNFQFTIDLGQADSWGEAERNAEKIAA